MIKQSENIYNSILQVKRTASPRLLLALDSAMLNYQKKHKDFILNTYQWFTKKLGYKAKNYVYKWFNENPEESVKVGYDDVMKVLFITQDRLLYEIAREELDSMMQIQTTPGQMSLMDS